MENKFIEEIKNKKIAILAFQREGMSTLKYIRKYLKDKEITILDKDEKLIDNEIIKNDKNVKTIFGDRYLDNLDEYDLIIKSPGVSLNNLDISNIKDKIKTQNDIILDYYSKNVIGITGTKGKSTTSSLLYKVLIDQKIDAYLCGNIGIPVFEYMDNIKDGTILVVEMSAYQTQYIRKAPFISVILNLYEEHLDFFLNKDNYYNSKLNLARLKERDDYLLYLDDNKELKERIDKINPKCNIIKVSNNSKAGIYIKNNKIYMNDEYICNTDIKRKIIGDHNLTNIMFVLAISKILNLNIKETLKSISEFEPLEHRLELVGTYKGVTFYNDSISTIPYSCIYAVETLKDVDTLILGGMDRKIDYTLLIDKLNDSNINNFICLPDTGHFIGKKLKNKNVIYVECMADAVKNSYKYTKKGKICLLSPAASSYNMYKNFEERGRDFKNKVNEYK